MDHEIAINVYHTYYDAHMDIEQFMNALHRGIKILSEGSYTDGLDLKDLQASNVALRYNYELLHMLLQED